MFFFFKQKTAYEMRISDWSSDVCASDLNPETERPAVIEAIEAQGFEVLGEFDAPSGLRGFAGVAGQQPVAVYATNDGEHAVRSEEHTSELQSLMRISYAVFCLKKKK